MNAFPVESLPRSRKELLPVVQFDVVVESDSLERFGFVEAAEVFVGLLLHSGTQVSRRVTTHFAESVVQRWDEAIQAWHYRVLGHRGQGRAGSMGFRCLMDIEYSQKR